MKSEFEIAITQLSSDRNLSPAIIVSAIEEALAQAYRKNFNSSQNVVVKLDQHTGAATVLVQKLVVEQVEDPETQMTVAEAQQVKPRAQVGDVIEFEITPKNFGRIAAQTAKQVIMGKIRDAERDLVYAEYKDRSGEIVNGVVRNIDGRTRNVTISLGKAEALLVAEEQIPGEHYRFNQRLRVYLTEVEQGPGHGPQITVSRTNKGLLRRLLEMEVPEIFSGVVEIKSIAREPGSRSKVAVASAQPSVDPVGSCVGPRGVRIQNIVNELNGEKIDVVKWSPNVAEYITNALSPAKVTTVYLNEADKTAKVVVPDSALSLAIGKEGQNARLAAKLTGWRIDIRSESEAAVDQERLAAEAAAAAALAREQQAAREAAAQLLAEAAATLEDEEPRQEIAAAEETIPERAEDVTLEPELPQELVNLPEIGLVTPEPAATEAAGGAAELPLEELAEEELFEDTPEEDDDKRKDGKPARKDKSKQRTLVFDERLGRVISKKRRKPGRSSGWDFDDEE